MPTRTNPGASCRSGWSCNATWLVLILLQLCASDAALFAVDLGSEFLKVSLIQPGRVPISIVGNEMSKRKTVADVAIVNGERFMGVEATALRTRHPSLVFYRLRDFLGKPASHPSVAQILRAGTQTQLQFELVDDPNRGTVRFKTGDNSTISAEELVGSILKYAKGITQAQAGQEVVDCVLTVPSFFGPTQKQAILDAARLADVNVLALVGSHAAAALQYGIERDFINKTENVVFYDMGSNAVQVAYVVFSSYQVKDKGKKKTINQLQVKDVVWNDNLGGDHLDWMLVDHLANEFFEKYGSDPRNTPRALAKLKKSVRQTKEVLSANTEAPIYVEELLDDRDFSSKISRNDFESLAADFFDAAKKPLEDIMIRNNLAVSDLDGVELLGGGTRVPKLQVVLSEVLGGRPLDRHLDADEAAVMGAGLVAANESTMFRLRQFGLVDGVVYPLSMQIDKPTGYKEDDNQDAGDIFKPRSLLPYMKRLPAKRVVHLPNFTADPFKISVLFNTSDGNSLPPGTDAEEYATYEVSGTKAAIDKYSDDFKVSLHFSTDNGGLLALDKVEYVAELQPSANAADVNITVNGTGDKQSQNETELAGDVLAGDSQHNGNESNAENTMSSSNGTETVASEFPESGNENSAPEGEDEAMGNGSTVRKENTTSGETETVKGEASKGGKPAKKKVIRITLHTSGPILVQPGLDKDSFSTSIKVMTAFWQKELEKKAADTAKNELESYILKTQEYLNIDEDIQQVTTEDQRSSFSSQLSDAEDWLYMEGEDEPAAEFRKRLRQLQEIGDKMSHRASELNRRPEAVAMAQEYINLLRKAINSWPEAKPWLDQTEIDKLVNKTDEFEEWLNGKIEEQSAKERHEDPVFRSEEVNYRRMILEKVFKRLSHKKAPKPPPPPPQAQGENETVSVNNTNTTESHGGEENEEHSILGSKKQEEESEAHDEL